MPNDQPAPTDDDLAPEERRVPDEAHARPPGVDDATVEALGKVSEALEWIERARGRLYDFHQMIGRADFLAGDGADLLEQAGHVDDARRLRADIVGRNVLDGRWTFQIVEEFDSLYYRAVVALEEELRNRHMAGRRHVFEAELKERRRTHGRPGHEARPQALFPQTRDDVLSPDED